MQPAPNRFANQIDDMPGESIHTALTWLGLFLVISMACNPFRSGKKVGNMTLSAKETNLDSLAGEARVLVVLVTNSSDRGIYWLDLDNHKLHTAKELHTNMPPVKGMMTWTGTHLVYGLRLKGFFSLAADGTHQQLTAFDYIGQLANDGKQILRFRKCGPDATGAGYTITPLDRFTEPPLICLPRSGPDPESWYSIHPIWNPYLAKADFVVSKRTGRGKHKVVESNTLVQVLDGGDLDASIDLGAEFPLEGAALYFQPRPDGHAFYIHNSELNASRVIDRHGSVIVDFDTLDAQLPHLRRTGRFSWSPDSQKAVLLYEDCRQGGDGCNDVLVLASKNFKEIAEISTLPTKLRFNNLIWSPDSTYLGIVTHIHQGKDDPPRIYTVNLSDHRLAEYIFPARMVLRHVQWLR